MIGEFIMGWDYSDGYSAFFEQDDATGYLYVSKDQAILQYVHIYNRETQIPKVCESDVEILRSQDGRKVAVAIWRELRGIIHLETMQTLKRSEGITDEVWLSGFEYELKPDCNGNMRAFIQCQ